MALVLYIRLISRLSCLLSGALRLLSGVFLLVGFVFVFFSFFNIFTDFSFVSSVLFFSFFSRFLFTFCSVSLSFVTVVVPLLSLPFVSSFRFFAGFSNCFFFKSFRLFTLCPISLVTLIIFLYRLAISSYRFFFVIFHDFF